ncbi:hypothetical protein [Agrobacterium radiobacter]|uniref:hypothetical protein n=1 Tax=Agrobacterium radiobacter TaxID=362 RepID=UPI003CE59711
MKTKLETLLAEFKAHAYDRYEALEILGLVEEKTDGQAFRHVTLIVAALDGTGYRFTMRGNAQRFDFSHLDTLTEDVDACVGYAHDYKDDEGLMTADSFSVLSDTWNVLSSYATAEDWDTRLKDYRFANVLKRCPPRERSERDKRAA